MQHHPEIERNLIRLLSGSLSGKRILDVGCGKGSWGFLARCLPGGREATIDGIEVYEPDVTYLRSTGTYDTIFNLDLAKKGLPNLEKYDYVFAFEILEHLPKKASIRLLDQLESITMCTLYVSTPNGLRVRKPIDSNHHSAHISGWRTSEFKKRGFAVEGVGFAREPLDHHQPLWYLMHYGLTPVSRRLPRISNTLFAYKDFSSR